MGIVPRRWPICQAPFCGVLTPLYAWVLDDRRSPIYNSWGMRAACTDLYTGSDSCVAAWVAFFSYSRPKNQHEIGMPQCLTFGVLCGILGLSLERSRQTIRRQLDRDAATSSRCSDLVSGLSGTRRWLCE